MILILSNTENSYVKPLSEGLKHTLLNLGFETEIIEIGHLWLDKNNSFRFIFLWIKNFIKKVQSIVFQKYVRLEQNDWISKKKSDEIWRKIALSNGVIFTSHIPHNFSKKRYKRIEEIKTKLNKPIINYDLTYLPTRSEWLNKMNSSKDFFGMERFDFYLACSTVSEDPLIEAPNNLFEIGMNIQSPMFFPEQKDFFVVLDFPQIGNEKIRNLEKKILNELNIKFLELTRPYKKEELAAIFRKTHLFFLSFRESFGLPIVELQLCGAKIVSPFKSWMPSHYIKSDKTIPGEGDLGSNFLIYENNKEIVRSILQKEKLNFNAQKNIDKFQAEYKSYYEIDENNLKRFLNTLRQADTSAKTV